MKSDVITEFGSRQIVDEIGGGGGGGSDAIWKPSVSAQGDISWTRTASTTVPTPQNIKGPQGETGPAGPQGPQGPQGEKGDPGTGGDVTWADIKNKPDNLATTEDVAAKVFIAEYNVTTAQEIRDYLDSAAEPFAPILVKRGNDYYTAVLATKSGTNDVIVRVMGSGSGDYIIFNYTVRGAVWSNSSYTFQKKLVSGTDIKTVNNESLLGSGNIEIQGGGGTVDQTYDATSTNAQSGTAVSQAVAGKADARNYQLCVEDVGGNVIQIGTIDIEGTTYGIFEFYYKTGALPDTTSATYSFATLLTDYTIESFIDATGVTNDGIFIGNGRTDGNNRLIVQQFSKNSKTITIKTYQDFSTKTATLKVQFVGTKATA